MKTNKSYTKRIKVTKNGKLIARKAGQNHFNARQTGRQRLNRKRTQAIKMSNKDRGRFLKRASSQTLRKVLFRKAAVVEKTIK